MYPLITHFNKMRQNTLPPDDRLEAAKTLPPLVRAYLEEHESFVTVWPHSRLVGSYAQKLCVGDVKDVDFLLFVEGAYEGDDMIEPKAMIADLKRALGGLAAYLGYEEDEITVEAARRSVHVHFKNHDFHLDVVPCIAPDGVNEPAYVPCKNLEKWVKTHPVGYIKKLEEINAAHGYNVKRLARAMKHFVHHKMKQKNMRPKSYWLGALLLQIIDEHGFDDAMTQGELFHWLVSEIHAKYRVTLDTSTTATPNIKDPILGHNISWNWGRNAFEMFMSRLKEAADWSADAIANEASKEDAIKLWQKIFGSEYFPTSIEDEAKSLAQSLRPGNAFVEPSGRVVASAFASAVAVAAPVTRFHGGKMARHRSRRPILSAAIQQTAVRRSFPSFRPTFHGASVTWKGRIQPRPGSPIYTLAIRYRPGRPPEVRVLRPEIRPDAPHLYPGGLLCLYWPKDRNWNSSKLIGETLIPWAAQWLLYYELWLDTGEWLGPESPHRYPGKMDRSE
jgi:Second Messenger Oligonucleotide or Dinucleotide Synthetase domain